MAALPGKIVLKSTTSKSLNDRFTELSRMLKSPPQVTLSGTRMGKMQEFHASAKNRRLAAQMANRPGVQAALGQPTRDTNVQNRLGNKNKLSIQGRLGRGKMTAANRGGRLQTKVAPGRIGQRRGGSFVAKRGGFSSLGRGRGNTNRIGRGVGRGMSSRGRGGKVQGGRGRGGARGAARGGNRGRGARNNTVKSKDDLDKELDDYMTHTKSHLDAELDQYMQGAANDQ